MPSSLPDVCDALDKVNISATFAYKYGPFFFAVALLVLIPFIALHMFKRLIGNAAAGQHYRNYYEDFRLYFRGSVYFGLTCVAIGVAWWVFQNYQETQKKSHIVLGVIVAGVEEGYEFWPAISQFQQISFNRALPDNTLQFVILSHEEVPHVFTADVWWDVYDGSAKVRTRKKYLAVEMTLGDEETGSYRFEFNGSDAASASILPISESRPDGP